MSKDDPQTFEQKLDQLEELIRWFESSEASVAESSDKFSAGLKLIEELKSELTETKQKIEKIKTQFEE